MEQYVTPYTGFKPKFDKELQLKAAIAFAKAVQIAKKAKLSNEGSNNK